MPDRLSDVRLPDFSGLLGRSLLPALCSAAPRSLLPTPRSPLPAYCATLKTQKGPTLLR